MYCRVLRVFALAFAGVSLQAQSPVADRIDVDLSRFIDPDPKQREKIAECLLNIETMVLQVDQLGVVVVGEYFIGGRVSDKQRVNAFRFGYSWCIDQHNDRERLAYADQTIVDPIMIEGPKTRVMTNSSHHYDRVRLGTTNHEAVGSAVRAPSEASIVSGALQRRGVFYPLIAPLDTAVGIYMGQRFSPSDTGLAIDRLVGTREFGGLLQAEFEFRPTRAMEYLRVISFRDSVPVQVDDFIAYDTTLPARDATKKWERNFEELMELHQVVKPKARTFSKWTRVGELRLPTSIHSMTLSGPNAVEVKADFTWKVNEQVPVSAFALETVGQVGPLTILPE